MEDIDNEDSKVGSSERGDALIMEPLSKKLKVDIYSKEKNC
jgi:hypothetical protein